MLVCLIAHSKRLTFKLHLDNATRLQLQLFNANGTVYCCFISLVWFIIKDQEAAAAAALPVVAPVPEVKPVHNEADDQPGELSGNESAADDHNETDAAPADSADSAAQNEQSESSEPSEHQTQGEPEAPTQENPAVSEQNGE